MKSFLKTLERFVEIVDNELQQPIVRVISGDVFTHDPTAHKHSSQDQVIQQAAPPRAAMPTNTTRESHPADTNVLCPPRLRPAGAHKK